MPRMARRESHPSVGRNRGPILEVLRRVFAPKGRVLEIASGSGEHAWFFASKLPGITWQPSEPTPAGLENIEAWRVDEPLPNLLAPRVIDTRSDAWGVGSFDAMFCANMIHISPWESCVGLIRGAGEHLVAGGVLVTYGPYMVDGQHTAPSNEAFDQHLRQRDPSWGIRDVEAVAEQAAANGLRLVERVAMPANNFSLVLHKDE